jgi:hypothetical protein
MKNLSLLLKASLPLIAFSAPAFAYVPPSAFIVKTVASKHAGIKGVRLRSIVSGMEGEKVSSTRFKAVTYYNPSTGTLRSYAVDDSNQRLYAVERKTDSATAADALLFWSNGKNVDLVLKARGIPVRTAEELITMKDEDERRASEVESLARWGNAVVWVIGKEAASKGAKSEAPVDPQLWIEKDTFLPIRLIASPQMDGALLDLQFEGQRFYHEFPYPRVITAISKKDPVLRDEVQELALVLDASEFRQPLVPGFTSAGNSVSSNVHDLIQKYFELIR